MTRLGEDGRSALVQTPDPVNSFPDLVAHFVRRLKVLCPAMGTARIAAVLSRAGLHLGRTTVRRMLKRRPRRVAPAATARRERCIRSSRPNHIWLVDLTTVPSLADFWISWLPWSVPQRWTLCCWVAVGIDHSSRRIMGARVFRGRPTAVAMSAFLAGSIRAAGQAPRHLLWPGAAVHDAVLPASLPSRRIRQRFGAIRKHGSIALVERCIRTLKDEGVWRSLAPIRWRTVGGNWRFSLTGTTVIARTAGWPGRRPTRSTSAASGPPSAALRAPGTWPRDARCARPQRRSVGGPACGSRSRSGTWKGERTFPSSR